MIAPASILNPQERILELVKEQANELMALVEAKHPEVRFVGPMYWPDENMWLVDAYFEGEDFELEDQLSERETDILLEDDICLSVLCMPLEAFPN